MHFNILHMPNLKKTLVAILTITPVAINPNDLFYNLFLNS